MNDLLQKAAQIGDLLDEHFPSPSIPLHHRDPFTLLIAVVLSAQCTDKRVNEISPLLFAKAATPHAMTALPVEEIEAIIRPCGLAPQKAKALAGLSRLLVEKHQGQVPANFPALEALPGVGHKTASVVMLQAFHVPAFPVDTHIHRLAARWGLSSGKSVEQTERDLKALYPQHRWGILHLQFILCGRAICKARPHDANACLFCSRFSSKTLFEDAPSHR